MSDRFHDTVQRNSSVTVRSKVSARHIVLVFLLILLLMTTVATSAFGLNNSSVSKTQYTGQYEPYVPENMQYFAVASSTLKINYNEYTVGPEKAVDGNFTTAWNEGASGTGVGEWIRVLPVDGERYTYRGFKIANGFQYHDYYKGDRWIKNNRVKYLLVYNDAGNPIESFFIEDVYNGYQYVYFSEPVSSNYLQFEILAVWEGTNFSDTCISEICPF
ncbi:MAG: hypothetical protein E7319_09045 [Clostridiales bacterium]|nr:hypothetical protein [Clostridiales bacterium]